MPSVNLLLLLCEIMDDIDSLFSLVATESIFDPSLLNSAEKKENEDIKELVDFCWFNNVLFDTCLPGNSLFNIWVELFLLLTSFDWTDKFFKLFIDEFL